MKGKDYKVCLLLGGNLNDVQKTFVQALSEMRNVATVLRKSALYRTKAWGMGSDVPDFINQAVIIKTKLEALDLLKKLLQIEKSLGRAERKNEGYESRTIDIDIIFFENNIIKSADLIIPHPRMHKRNFVLVPMLEVAKEWVHPIFHKTVPQLLADSKDKLEVSEA